MISIDALGPLFYRDQKILPKPFKYSDMASESGIVSCHIEMNYISITYYKRSNFCKK